LKTGKCLTTCLYKTFVVDNDVLNICYKELSETKTGLFEKL